ncbi:MAG: LacI family transcriptional regulator [Paracoccaceae bacterium]
MTSGVDAPVPHLLPDSDHERPTLKTIAAETGLAVATVSRALKDAPDIGEATKRRVREAAARLGYRPNRAGVRLRTGKTNVIALVLSTESDVMNHTSQLIYSIANALRGTPYHLIVTPFFPDQDPMDPIRYLVETESADAVILNQTKPDDPRVRYMAERHFPFATHGRTDMGIEHSYYDFDNEAFATVAVAALAAAGRKRLLLIPPPRTHSYARHMITGFAEAAGAHGLAFEVLTTATSDSGGTAIEAAVLAHLDHSAQPPDGLLCGSTTAAMAAVNAAEQLGLVLGRDFDLVAKEAIRFLHRFRREILVVQEDVREAGDFLARAVVAAVERRDSPAKQGLERPGRVERASDDKGGRQ